MPQGLNCALIHNRHGTENKRTVSEDSGTNPYIRLT
jgi:hypothetical protein